MEDYSCIFTGCSIRGLCYICVLKALEEKAYRNEYNIIRIDVSGVQFTDFKLSKIKKKQIYDIGYKTTMKELK